jgi:hypothetical protein
MMSSRYVPIVIILNSQMNQTLHIVNFVLPALQNAIIMESYQFQLIIKNYAIL